MRCPELLAHSFELGLGGVTAVVQLARKRSHEIGRLDFVYRNTAITNHTDNTKNPVRADSGIKEINIDNGLSAITAASL